MKFTPDVPGTYNIEVTLNSGNIQKSIFTGHAQVKKRRLEVVGELDFRGESLQNPTGIAVNSKGLIAVADYSGNCILLFDKEGKYLRKFSCKGSNVGQLHSPSDITFVNDDEILVTDELNHRIQLFSVHTGEAVKAFGKKGMEDGELKSPQSVCMDGEERVVVADCFNNRMQVFTKDGEPMFSFGANGLEKLNSPTGCIFHENINK